MYVKLLTDDNLKVFLCNTSKGLFYATNLEIEVPWHFERLL